MYQVFGYLSFFRLDELAIQDYRKLIMSQEPHKMNIFLHFVFNGDELRQSCKEPWMNLYDHTYIDEKIIGGISNSVNNRMLVLRHRTQT